MCGGGVSCGGRRQGHLIQPLCAGPGNLAVFSEESDQAQHTSASKLRKHPEPLDARFAETLVRNKPEGAAPANVWLPQGAREPERGHIKLEKLE